MPNIRIKDIPTTASATVNGDFFAVDSSASTRKLDAFNPTFGGRITASGTGTNVFRGPIRIGNTTYPGYNGYISESNTDSQLNASFARNLIGSTGATYTIANGELSSYSGFEIGTDIRWFAASGVFTTGQSVTPSELMRLKQGGNLLVGTSTDSGHRIQAAGNISATGTVFARLANTLLYEAQVYAANSSPSGTNGAVSQALFLSQPGYTTYIGTTGNGTVASYRVNSLGNVVQDQQGYVISDAARGLLIHSINGPTIFATQNSGSEKMRLLGNGNLLIGTDVDDTIGKLQVSGAATISGNTNIGGSLIVTGAANGIICNGAGLSLNTAGSASVRFQDAGVSKWWIYKLDADTNLYIRDMANGRMQARFNPNTTSNTAITSFYSKVDIDATNVSDSTTTGAFVVAGGVGIGGSAYLGGLVVSNKLFTATRSFEAHITHAVSQSTAIRLASNSGGANTYGAEYGYGLTATGTPQVRLSGIHAGTTTTFLTMNTGDGVPFFTPVVRFNGEAITDSLPTAATFGATNKRIAIGFDQTNNFGFIASADSGTSWQELRLNPYGGTVRVPGSSDPSSTITGALVVGNGVSGGIGVSGGVYAGGTLTATTGTNSGVLQLNLINNSAGTSASSLFRFNVGTRTATLQAYNDTHATLAGQLRIATSNGDISIIPSGVPTVTFGASGTTFAGPINASGDFTVDKTEPTITFKRAANTNLNIINLWTGAAADFGIGLRNTSDSDLHIYNYGTANDALKIAKATSAVTLSGNLTVLGTVVDPAITGTILEDIFTITDAAAFEVDPGNGSIQLITLGASRTPKATNFAAGESVTMMIDDGTAFTLTWTDATWGTGGVKWVGGSAPTLATTGYTVIQLWKVGTQVYGARVGDVV